MAWNEGDFLASLTSVAPRTVEAYGTDLAGFVAWAERGGITAPNGVDRTLLRRYVAHLATRSYAKRSIARKVSALRRYFASCASNQLHRIEENERSCQQALGVLTPSLIARRK